MSNDLISREEAINGLRKCTQLGRKSCAQVVEMIKALPTAYDVDKVVEQLKHIKIDNSCRDCKYKDECDKLQEFCNPPDDVDLCGLTIKHIAIDIVRAGIVNKQ